MQRSGFETFCRFAAAWGIAAVILTAAGAVIALCVPPVTPEELALRAAPFLKSIHHGMKPEPAESAVYFALCLLAFPAAAAGWFAAKKLPESSLKPLPVLWGVLFALLLCGAGGFHVALEALDTPWRVGLWLVTAAGLGALLLHKRQYVIPEKWIRLAVLATALGVIFCCRIHAPARMDQNFDEHANIILYALNSALHGMGDLHFYGFYPLFLAPVFRLTGTGLIPVSLVMNVLYLAAIFCAVAAAEKLIRNRLLVLLFGISLPLLLNGYDFFLSDLSLRIEPYFAYYPIRMLFPMGMAALFCCSSGKIRTNLHWIAPVLGAAACYFSPDSGIAAAGAAFVGCAAPVLNREMRRDGIRFALQFAGIFAGSLALFPLILMVWSGSMPPLSDYFHYMKLYQQSGLIMLPVEPFPSAWIAVVLIYLGAILWGGKELCSGRSSVRNGSILLFLAVLGCGLFLYYVGRSHPKNLISCSWPAILLLFCFTDRVLRGIRCKMLPGWFAAGVLPAILLAAALPWIPLTRIPKLLTAWKFTALSFTDPSETDRLIGKILFLTEGEETVNLLSPMQGILYGETGKRPGMKNFNLVELLIQSEMDRSMEEFRKAQYPLLIHGDGILPADVLDQYVPVHRDAEDLFVYYIPKKRLTASSRSSAVSQ